MPRFVLQDGSGDRKFDLGSRTLIGRDEGLDVSISDPNISRRHAEVVRIGSLHWIKDLGSRNGTLVNGRRVSSAVLRNGDTVRLGSSTLLFQAPDEDRSLASSVAAGEPSDTIAIVTSLDARAITSKGTLLPEHAQREALLQERLSILCELSRAIGTVQNLEELLDQLLGQVFSAFPPAARAFVIVIDPDTGVLAARAGRTRAGQPLGTIAISQTVARKVIGERQAVICTDASSDERFSAAASLGRFNVRSLMCAPLLIGDDVLGVLHVDCADPERSFSESDMDLLAAMAAQAAIYLQNVRLHRANLRVERLAAVGETVAGLAHCVKNILNSIQAGAYLVDMGLDAKSPDNVSKGWDVVKRNNHLMTELLMDLLNYGKERKPQRTPTDLNKLCADICEMMSPKAATIGAELRLEPEQGLPLAELDPVAIQRCLSNLVTNALDAMDKQGGLVLVSTRSIPGRDFVEFTVSDNGCGIPPDHLARLFNLFFSTKGSKGTGLGLAVTRKIIEEHGGSICVSSKVGDGTEFITKLPIQEPPA